MLSNSMLNGLSVKLIYKIFFLKNTCIRPLVKITINVSNFLTGYRPIVFFKEEKNLSGLLIKKKLSVSKATYPEWVFKTVQIILWETPVTKCSRKVFKNVNLVRVLALITNWASFFNNKIFLKFPVDSYANFLMFFSFYSVFYSQWTLNIFSIRDAAYWTTSFWIACYEIRFWFLW